MTTEYTEELMKFVIGEEVKVKRTKGEKAKIKELGVGHLADEAKGTSVKEGKREYASATISKADVPIKVTVRKQTERELKELIKLLQGLDKYVENSAILSRLLDSDFDTHYNNLRFNLEDTLEEIKNK